MKRYIIFVALFACICVQGDNSDIFDELIQQQLEQELKKLENDPKNSALLEEENAKIEAISKELRQKDRWLYHWFKIYGNKPPEKILKRLNPHDPLITLHKLSISEHNWSFAAPLTAIIYSLIFPSHAINFVQDPQIQKISAHQLSDLLLNQAKPLVTIKLPCNHECSVTPSGVLTGCAEHAINTYFSPSKSTVPKQAFHATTTVLARLIEHSIKPVDVQPVLATEKIVVLSNKNITVASTKTIGNAIKELPDRTTSAQELVQNFAQNLSGEICYNLTAQLLRPAAQKILPEGLVELLLPHDHQPKHFMHETVKYGIALTATCILHILIEDYKKSPILIPGL